MVIVKSKKMDKITFMYISIKYVGYANSSHVGGREENELI